MHRLMHLSPCIALCHEQCLLRGGRPTAPQLRSIEPIIERVKVFLRQVELRKLGEGSQTHQQGVPEYQVQSLQLAPCGWCCPFFLPFFLLPAVHCDLLTGLDGSLPFFRKGTDDVLGVNETNLAFAAKLVLATPREHHSPGPGIVVLGCPIWLKIPSQVGDVHTGLRSRKVA